MQEVHDFLKKCGAYYLATVEGDQPRVRPFGTIHFFDGKLYIQTGKVKDVSKQMIADPKVEICAFDGKEWIRVQATAVDDDRLEAKRACWMRTRACRGGTPPRTTTCRCCT